LSKDIRWFHKPKFYWFHRSKPSPFIWSSVLVCRLWFVRINCPVIGQN